MGKGGGCVPSKKRPPAVDSVNAPATISSPTNPQQSQTNETTASNVGPTETVTVTKLKILIIFYSMYGHVERLARRMKKGVESVENVEAVLYRVPETLDEHVLGQMRAPPKDDEIEEIKCVSELEEADGLLFGFPTRYGAMAGQMKAFFDSTGGLWREQKLAGKPAGFFVSTGTQGGGQETTAWTAITQLAHHGMLFVPVGYTFGANMFKMDAIRGGTPYGAGVFAGDGTREPSETELALAEHQGKYMAGVVKKLARV